MENFNKNQSGRPRIKRNFVYNNDVNDVNDGETLSKRPSMSSNIVNEGSSNIVNEGSSNVTNEGEEVKQCEGICTSRTGICGNKGTIVCGTKFYCPLHIEDGIQLYESEKKLDEKNAKRKKAKEEAIKEVEKTLEIKPKDDSDNSDDESPFVKKQLELKIVKPKNKEKSVDKIKKNIKLPTLSLDKLDDIEEDDEDDEDDNFSLEENIEDDEDIIEEEVLEDADNEDLEDEDYIPDFNDNISEYNSE